MFVYLMHADDSTFTINNDVPNVVIDGYIPLLSTRYVLHKLLFDCHALQHGIFPRNTIMGNVYSKFGTTDRLTRVKYEQRLSQRVHALLTESVRLVDGGANVYIYLQHDPLLFVIKLLKYINGTPMSFGDEFWALDATPFPIGRITPTPEQSKRMSQQTVLP
jgi:hypothetical protein